MYVARSTGKLRSFVKRLWYSSGQKFGNKGKILLFCYFRPFFVTLCFETILIGFSIAENGGFDQKLKLRFSIFKEKAKNESKKFGN